MQNPKNRRSWFCQIGGEELGPLSDSEFRALAVDGRLQPEDLVWKAGKQQKRTSASKVRGLFRKRAANPKVKSAQSTVVPNDVFISYSSKDKSTADAICGQLEREKIRCWIAPRDVVPGSHYAEAIIDGINTCRAMVVVFSESSNGSQQVLRLSLIHI